MVVDNSMPITAEFKVEVPESLARTLEGSLLPEAESPLSDRSSVEVSLKNGDLIIRIQTSDVMAMRAAVNSYLRWVGAIVGIIESI